MTFGQTILAAALAAAFGGASALAGAPSAFAQSNLLPDRGPAFDWRMGESSVGVLFGVGYYENDDFNRDLVLNGIAPIENGFEYGLQYRRRASRWLSIGGELVRLDGRTNTTGDAFNNEFAIQATPLLADVYFHALQMKRISFMLFAGAGPLIATKLSQTFPNGAVLDGVKTGFIVQGGGEGEVRFGPNFGFFLRGLYRQAETNQVTIDDGTGLDPVRYDIDFNGPAVNFGPRWYFGGLEGPAPAPAPAPTPAPAPADSL